MIHPRVRIAGRPRTSLWVRSNLGSADRRVGAGCAHTRALPRCCAGGGHEGLLPLWSTSGAELGAQFGVGAQLYFDLLRFCGFACFAGAFLSSPSLVYNLYNPQGSNYQHSEVDSTGLLAFSTAGARLNCDAQACRTLTAYAACAEVAYVLLLVLGLGQLRRHRGRLKAGLSWSPPEPRLTPKMALLPLRCDHQARGSGGAEDGPGGGDDRRLLARATGPAPLRHRR